LKTPVTLLCISATIRKSEIMGKQKTIKLYKYEECESCLNREFDPFQCIDCEDAENFEPEDHSREPDVEEDLSYEEFVGMFRSAA
jgi:hypothetical protein